MSGFYRDFVAAGMPMPAADGHTAALAELIAAW